MALVSPFNTATPGGNDDPREGDDRIRETKAALIERFAQAGIYWDDAATPDQDAGKIALGVQATNKLYIYESDKTGVIAEFDDSGIGTSGDPHLVTLGAGGLSGPDPLCKLIVSSIDANLITVASRLTSSGVGTIGGTHQDLTLSGVKVDKLYSYNITNAAPVTIPSGTNNNVIITGTSYTTSRGSGDVAENRVFLAFFTGHFRKSGSTGTSLLDLNLQYNIGGLGWNTSSVYQSIQMPPSTQAHADITKFDAKVLSTNSESIQWRAIAHETNSGGDIIANDFALLTFELFTTG